MARFNVNKAQMDFLAKSHRNPDTTDDPEVEGENNRMRKFSFTVGEILEVIGTITDVNEEINFYVGKLNKKSKLPGTNSDSVTVFASKFGINKPSDVGKLKNKQVVIMTKATDTKEVPPDAPITVLFGEKSNSKIFPTGSFGAVSKICPPPSGCV